eukprot:101650-Amphidinium_carterae.1
MVNARCFVAALLILHGVFLAQLVGKQVKLREAVLEAQCTRLVMRTLQMLVQIMAMIVPQHRY